MTEQLEIDLSRARGHEGAKRAAECASPEWIRRALLVVAHFAHTRKQFLVEDVREYAGTLGLIGGDQPYPRAWGHVIQLAVREGLIVKAGYAPAKSSNSSPKTLWRAA